MAISGAISEVLGLTGLLDRWVKAENVAGLMFIDTAFVTLGGYKIKLPVDISFSHKRKVHIEEAEELLSPVVFASRVITSNITLAGRAGIWKKRDINIPGGLTSVVPVAGAATALLGVSDHIDKVEMLAELYGILRKADDAIEIEDKEGILAGKGIQYVFPLDFNGSPRGVEYNWTMSLIVDFYDNPVEIMFPEGE